MQLRNHRFSINNHRYFINDHQIKYTIWWSFDGIHHLWQWSNQTSGWRWCGDFANWEKAKKILDYINSFPTQEVERDFSTPVQAGKASIAEGQEK